MIFGIRQTMRLLAACFISIWAAACGGGQGDESADAARPRPISIVSGGQQGLYYQVANLFASIYNEQLKDRVRVNVEASGGSAANARLLGGGNADLALMQNDIAWYAHNAKGIFPEKIENLRAVTALYPEVVHLVARADAGIETPADLRGRKVSIGAPGSGTEQNALQILEAHGLSTDDLALVERLQNVEASDKIKDGHIEAAFLTYGIGAPVIVDMSVLTDIELVPLDQQTLNDLASRYAYYKPTVIPGGTYEGVERDTPAVSVVAWLIARAELSEELVYDLTKTLYDNLETLHGPKAPARLHGISREGALAGLSIPLHPGAERYFAEQGLTP